MALRFLGLKVSSLREAQAANITLYVVQCNQNSPVQENIICIQY